MHKVQSAGMSQGQNQSKKRNLATGDPERGRGGQGHSIKECERLNDRVVLVLQNNNRGIVVLEDDSPQPFP